MLLRGRSQHGGRVRPTHLRVRPGNDGAQGAPYRADAAGADGGRAGGAGVVGGGGVRRVNGEVARLRRGCRVTLRSTRPTFRNDDKGDRGGGAGSLREM
ncbi:MAG: hypothetical protein MZV70_63365 [Desulfobacterales bacterium]|nr:hypothetical protein [Desulfobacterales bacterium]